MTQTKGHIDKETSQREGYKLTKLGWIPEDWEILLLGKLASVSSGGTPDRKKPVYWNGEIPWITTSLIDFNEINKANEFITQEGLDNSAAKVFPENTILMALYGQGKTRGKVGVLKIPATTNQACAAIISEKESVVTNYLFYHLAADYLKIRNLSNTGNQENLSGELVKSIQLRFPPLPEQKAIAAVLSKWDEGIEKLTELLELKAQKQKGLMQQLLTGKKRFAGFEGEWVEFRLKELFKRVTRKNTEGNTNVATISAQRGLVSQNTFFKKNVASDILDNYFLLEKNEFAYNKSYSNGYPMGAIKRLNLYDKAVVTTLYICFEVIDEKVTDRDFFEHFFEAGRLVQGLMKIAHEGGRAHGLLNVTPSDFFNLKVTIPNFKEQQKIASVLNAAEQELKVLREKLGSMKAQKKGLMQQLLTGKVRVKTGKL